MSTAAPATYQEVLSEFFAADAPPMPPEAARWVLAMQLPDRRKERLLELLDLGNQGKLTEQQRHEMEAYRDAGNLISLLQAKARLSLQQCGPTPSE
jgi:hypothetical protein